MAEDQDFIAKREALRREAIGERPDSSGAVGAALKDLNLDPNVPTGAEGLFGDRAKRIGTDGMISLANSFINRYYKETGKMPSEEAVQDFTYSNFTPSMAGRMIQGNVPQESLESGVAKNYIMSNFADEVDAFKSSKTGSGQPANSIDGAWSRYYDEGQKGAESSIRAGYGDLRRDLLSRQAVYGTMGSGQGIVEIATLGRGEMADISEMVGKFAIAKATGLMDYSQFAENLKTQKSQFQQSLAFQRENAGESAWQKTLDRAMSERVANNQMRTQRDTAQDAQPGGWERFAQVAGPVLGSVKWNINSGGSGG